MSTQLFDTIGIVQKYDDPEKVSGDVLDIEYFCHDSEGLFDVKIIPEEQYNDRTLIIALGGDGTVMTACRLAAKTGSMVIGVNHGNLGFLADVNASGLMQKLLRELLTAQDDEYNIQHRHLLSSKITTTDGQVDHSNFAVNEFHISSSNGRVLEYVLEIDGRQAAHHTADGVIVSSPTGSTAYSLSAGGAIMMPTLQAMQIVPVAPHMLTSRPLIVGEQHEVAIRVKADREVFIRCDGIDVECAPHNNEYVIKTRIGRQTVGLVKYSDSKHNFFDVMKEKLYYGRRGL